MCLSQYRSYCAKFWLRQDIDSKPRTILPAIAGKRFRISLATIQISFKMMKIITYVYFPILKADVPSLINMKDSD